MRAVWLKATIAALGLGLCASSAAADGLVVKRSDPYVYVAPDAIPVTYNWSGFYLGGHLGAANSQVDWDYNEPIFFDTYEHSRTGFVGGGFAGLQMQVSWLVFGAEVGYLWADQSKSTGDVLLGHVATSTVHDLLLVTGKFGWANDNMLAYFKGGYATAEVEFRTKDATNGALWTSSNEREHGWVAGVGLEYALWQHVILGVEYNYIKLNTETRIQDLTVDMPRPGPVRVEGATDIQSLTARLSFKLGGGRPEPMLVK